jgi:hypothetical protein
LDETGSIPKIEGIALEAIDMEEAAWANPAVIESDLDEIIQEISLENERRAKSPD